MNRHVHLLEEGIDLAIRVGQLIEHRCIIDESISQPTRWMYKTERGKKHVTVSSDIGVNNAELVADFAVDGFGVAYLPDFLVKEHIASGRLVRILQSYEIDPVPVSLVYSMNRMMSPALRALIDFMLEKPQKETLS